MSTRERWIVYPLLFMTLGIAMRDKVVPPSHLGNPWTQLQSGEITSQRIRCNELQVEQVICDRMESNQSKCRALFINGPTGQPVVAAGADNNTHAGLIETFNSAGIPQVRLISTDSGGIVSTIGRAGRAALIMGDTGQNLGVFAQLPELGQLICLTLPWRFEAKPGVLHPPQSPKPSNSPPKQPTPQSEKALDKKKPS